jgi:hypothetical protein
VLRNKMAKCPDIGATRRRAVAARRLLLEAQQRTKRRLVNGCLAYRSLVTADRDGVDAESRPSMTEARARDKIAEGPAARRKAWRDTLAPAGRAPRRPVRRSPEPVWRCRKKLGNYGKSWA